MKNETLTVEKPTLKQQLTDTASEYVKAKEDLQTTNSPLEIKISDEMLANMTTAISDNSFLKQYLTGSNKRKSMISDEGRFHKHSNKLFQSQ